MQLFLDDLADRPAPPEDVCAPHAGLVLSDRGPAPFSRSKNRQRRRPRAA